MRTLLIACIACLALAGVAVPASAQPSFADDPPWVDPPRRVESEPPHAANLSSMNKKDPDSSTVTAIVEIRTREPQRLLRLATPAVEAVGGTAEIIQWANRENTDDVAIEVIANEERMLEIIATVQSLDREATEADGDEEFQARVIPETDESIPQVHFFEGDLTEMAELRPILPEPIDPAPRLDQVEIIHSNFSTNDLYTEPPQAERLVTPTATSI
ncbi:hypothetical protein KQI84_09150 [bacterium]|nr:hypothetical protein [bacterium]